MFIDQNSYVEIVHAWLCSVGFQFVLCAFGIGLELCEQELLGGLIVLCFRGYERNGLLVVFGELPCSFLTSFVHSARSRSLVTMPSSCNA